MDFTYLLKSSTATVFLVTFGCGKVEIRCPDVDITPNATAEIHLPFLYTSKETSNVVFVSGFRSVCIEKLDVDGRPWLPEKMEGTVCFVSDDSEALGEDRNHTFSFMLDRDIHHPRQVVLVSRTAEDNTLRKRFRFSFPESWSTLEVRYRIILPDGTNSLIHSRVFKRTYR